MLALRELFLPCLLLLVIWLFVLSQNKIFTKSKKIYRPKVTNSPKSYPIIGHLIDFYLNKRKDRFQWLCNLIVSSEFSTFTVHPPFGSRMLFTADVAVVEHILKTHMHVYQKGPHQKSVFKDLFGDSMFTENGDMWKFQRQISSHAFSTKSLQGFVEKIVDFELFNRLIPILLEAAKNKTVLDLQDILQRFAFDNICMMAFGYDPQYLLPSMPEAKFAQAFEDALMICGKRFRALPQIMWKIRRFLNVGHEKKLKDAVSEIRELATSIVEKKKRCSTSCATENDILSSFLKHDNLDENLIVEIVIGFILAGRDTTSAALTWFFWLLHKNKNVEEEILTEILLNNNNHKKNENSRVVEELKNMDYTHAALCESMRLYPPVPINTKQAACDDILPNGMLVKRGMLVSYVPYAMGRSERIWGVDWAEYRPERWLAIEKNERSGEPGTKWRFVPRDLYSYPVFQAGPRVCLGKEMGFLQMKRIVSGILERFKVVPVVEDKFEPVYVPRMTSKMKGGFPVRFEERLDAVTQ